MESPIAASPAIESPVKDLGLVNPESGGATHTAPPAVPEDFLFEATETHAAKLNGPKASINTADFDDDLPPPPDDDDLPGSPEGGWAPQPAVSYDEYVESAKNAIMMVDGLDQLILPFGYKWAMFKKHEFKRAREMYARHQEEGEAPEAEWKKGDLILAMRYKAYLDVKKIIPLKEQEIKTLTEPLAKTFQKYNITIGPEAALFMAIMAVFSPRLTPLLAAIDF